MRVVRWTLAGVEAKKLGTVNGHTPLLHPGGKNDATLLWCPRSGDSARGTTAAARALELAAVKLTANRDRVECSAESAFESWHHHINIIKTRCHHIKNAEAYEDSIRKQWAIRCSPEGLAARTAFKTAAARGPRKSTAMDTAD